MEAPMNLSVRLRVIALLVSVFLLLGCARHRAPTSSPIHAKASHPTAAAPPPPPPPSTEAPPPPPPPAAAEADVATMKNGGSGNAPGGKAVSPPARRPS